MNAAPRFTCGLLGVGLPLPGYIDVLVQADDDCVIGKCRPEILDGLEVHRQLKSLGDFHEAKPGLGRAALPPFGVCAFLRVDPIGVDFLDLPADPFDIDRRQRAGQSERTIDHPADISGRHMILELTKGLTNLC